MNIAINASGVSAWLGNTHILHDIHLDFANGQWTSIVGPNGAGKSTLLKVLAGLLPHRGTVSLFGQPLSRVHGRLRAQQLAWMGQNETTDDDLTVWDVVMLGRLPHLSWLATPAEHDDAAVEHALRSTQAWDWCGRTLGQLSEGERQRVLLARALAVQAKVVLMDEPLTNLDPPHQADWLALVHTLVSQGTTVISVLHELSIALCADQMVIMSAGRMTHQGACSDALTHRALEAVFENRIAILPLGKQWVAQIQTASSE